MEFKFRAVDDRRPVPTSQGHFPLSGEDVPEAERLRREEEKRKIKEEIIAAGLARRRALEAEVLRELRLEGIEFPGSERPPAIDHHPQVPESDEEKLIVLVKPVPGHCGVKRKGESLSEVPLLPCPGVKKSKKEWSCALCHVSSNSERALNGHLQGRKHKAKEAALKAQVAARGCSTSPKLNADIKVITPAISASDFGADAKMKVEEQVGSKTEELASQRSKSLKKKTRAVVRAERTPEFQLEKKFKYWCEICKVGAYAPSVMDGHLKGKKHLKVVRQLGQSEKAVAGIPSWGLSADGEKEDDIAIEKADGSMVQDIKTEGVQDVQVNRKIESAALNVIAEAHSKVVQEAYAELTQLLLKSIGEKDDIAIKMEDGSMV